MMRRQFDQALFGYARGHRLLNASAPLDDESSRILRVVTDMGFEGRSESYLTALPLPTVGAHALIRSWPAGEWMRPGAVWSRVLLLPWQDLGRIADFSELLAAIAPLSLRSAEDVDKLAQAVALPLDVNIELRESSSGAIDGTVNLDVLLNGLYSSSRTVVMASPDPSREEAALLAVFAQQWPRLRRSFAFRTRYRSSETAVKFDLEIVEKRDRVSDQPAVREWARSLAQDIRGGSTTLRTFLHRYGSESRRGRRDMSVLVKLHDALLDASSRTDAIRTLFQEFPTMRDMPSLKFDIFAREGAIPIPESERIGFAVAYSDRLDLADYQVGRRLVAMVLDERADSFIGPSADFAMIPESQIEGLLEDIADQLNVETVLQFARLHEDLALLVAARRPDFLENGRLWEALEGEAVGDVFNTLEPSVQRLILERLLASSAVPALVIACSARSNAWWQLVEIASTKFENPGELAEKAAVLRKVLERIGMASLSGSPARGVSARYALVILLAAPLQAGLWRRLNFKDWMNALVATQGGDLRDPPRIVLERLLALTLASGTQSGDAVLRKRSWELAFARLHEALRSPRFDSESWAVLTSVLPSGPEWDRCYRLRRGAVAEIRRDDWAAGPSSRLIGSAGQDARDMIEQLNRRKKARTSWVEDVLRLIGMK